MKKITLTESKLRNIISETINKFLTESGSSGNIVDHLEEYSPSYIFQMYEDGEKLFPNLINASMYKQALTEFIKYGHFMRFPTRYLYQWMAIIMSNVAKISAITTIAGHSDWSATDEFIDYYFGNTEDPYDAWDAYKEEHGEDDDYGAMTDFLDERGFYDWTKLPDGSDAWSDYGLQPLLEICSEYNDNMSPEEVIVLINRALDVVHCRGDLASAFITGGSKSLDFVSNGNNITESKLRGIIRESIINALLEDIDVNYEKDNGRQLSHSTTWRQIANEIAEQGYSIINVNIGSNKTIEIRIEKYGKNGYYIYSNDFKYYTGNITDGLRKLAIYLHNKRALNRQQNGYQ